MRTKIHWVMAAGCILSVLGGGQATAQDKSTTLVKDAQNYRPGFGARVGGYGFRQAEPDGATSWEDCRMDGVGVFSTVDLTQHFFGELSLDMYHAKGEVVNEGMDRLSMHALGSVGVRMLPNWYISPYVQLGGGVEWTTVDMIEENATASGWYPAGFMGIGGEINVTDNVKLGANIRALMMIHPDHSHGADGTVHTHGLSAAAHGLDTHELPATTSQSSEVPMSFETAGQAQFFLRYAL